jgi:hypothetical protein
MKFDSLPKEYVEGVDKLLSKPVGATTLFNVVYELLGDPVAEHGAFTP